jgi:hypothetical protein
MLTQGQIQALKSPFPSEALSADTSRGFELTSIKAAYVIERLNDVFGLCGTGWRYAHSPFEEVHTDTGRVEIVTEVALQYRLPAATDGTGCSPVKWDNGWICRNGGNSRNPHADSTALWKPYRTEGAAAHISIETAKALAGKANWNGADLRRIDHD